jgi:hypothetical protein
MDQFDSTTRMASNRYLFITAEFDPSIIPLPELRPIPEMPEEGDEDELEVLKQEIEIALRIKKEYEQEKREKDGK